MNMFLDDCGYDVTVHDNQTLWFETAIGEACMRNNNMQKAAKEFNHVEKHFESMINDQYDYYMFMMRKFSCNAFEKMIEMFDKNIFENKQIRRGALGYVNLLKNVEKQREEELKTFQARFDEYHEGDEYKKLSEELKKKAKDDDEDVKKDTDPKGFKLYKQILDDEFDFLQFIDKVSKKTLEDPIM